MKQRRLAANLTLHYRRSLCFVENTQRGGLTPASSAESKYDGALRPFCHSWDGAARDEDLTFDRGSLALDCSRRGDQFVKPPLVFCLVLVRGPSILRLTLGRVGRILSA
jgi:hypothetical protein